MENLDSFETDKKICMHYEDDRERFEGAVVPPIFQNTLFTYQTFDILTDALQSEHSYYVYGRGTNPTVEIVEKSLLHWKEEMNVNFFLVEWLPLVLR